MPGYSEVALDIRALGLPELRIPNLFIPTKLVPPSYTSIALGPPPGLPTTPRLPPQSPQMSDSITPAQPPKEISSTPLRRDSIHNHSYKSALQSSRSDATVYEPSDSSGGSQDTNDAHPAQFIQFTRRGSSPGRQRRLNPKLVEFLPSYQCPTDSVLHPFIRPYRSVRLFPSVITLGADLRLQIFRHLVPSFTFNNADMVRTANMVMIIFWKTNIMKNLERTPKRPPARLPMRVCSLPFASSQRPSSVCTGGICSWGDECVYGHFCPQGTTCYFLKLGNCKFKARQSSFMSWDSALRSCIAGMHRGG